MMVDICMLRKINMKKIILLLLIMLSVSGCQSNNEINMGGSSSVLPLIENIKNDYQTLHNNIVVTYDGSGSSKGIEGVKNNIYQFGFLSRDLSAKEQEDHLNVKLLAYDGIALIVNPRNPINNLTTAQIKAIYSGTITNWQQVGGRDLNISLIARDDASGTRQAFDQIIGIKDLSEHSYRADKINKRLNDYKLLAELPQILKRELSLKLNSIHTKKDLKDKLQEIYDNNNISSKATAAKIKMLYLVKDAKNSDGENCFQIIKKL